MTDEELINEHRWRWNAWMKRRKQFGEMGASADRRLTELEMEARSRQIPDAQLLEGCKQSFDDIEV